MEDFSVNEFFAELSKAQDLMLQEKYSEALEVLRELQKIEKEGDFDYSLTHKLYQLISNSESLLNQQKLLRHVEEIAKNKASIPITELHEFIVSRGGFKIDLPILKRELELLILRAIIPHKIVGNDLIFH